MWVAWVRGSRGWHRSKFDVGGVGSMSPLNFSVGVVGGVG